MGKLKYLDLTWNQLQNTRDDISILRKHAPVLLTLDLRHNNWQKVVSKKIMLLNFYNEPTFKCFLKFHTQGSPSSVLKMICRPHLLGMFGWTRPLPEAKSKCGWVHLNIPDRWLPHIILKSFKGEDMLLKFWLIMRPLYSDGAILILVFLESQIE